MSNQRLLQTRLLQTLFLAAAVLSAHSAKWRFSNPQPHGSSIHAMVQHEGRVWQVGERGQIFSSNDLDEWRPAESTTRESLRAAAVFHGKLFIAAGNGTVVSGAGAKFSAQSLGTADWLEGIAASDSRIVAVGDNGAIYSSDSGANWARRGNFSAWLRGVAFAEGRFVAVGEGGFVAESADGATWTQKPSGTTRNLNAAGYVNGAFWLLGENGTLLRSQGAGFSSVAVGVTNELFSIAANEREIVIAGDQVLLRSENGGTTWLRESDDASVNLAPNWPYYSVLWDGRLFLAAGRTGLNAEGFRADAASPLIWYWDSPPTRDWLWRVTRAPDFYAAAGLDGTIVTSVDGVDWNREAVPAKHAKTLFLGIGGDEKCLVAVGDAGGIAYSENKLGSITVTNAAGMSETKQASLFGISWSAAASVTTNDLQGIAASSTLYVAAGARGTILSSANGRDWRRQNSRITTYLSAVASWPGGFVAAGEGGVILTSSDAVNWTRQNSRVTDWIYSVRHLGGKLIATGDNGLILISMDAKNWTRATTGTSEWLNDCAYVNSTWFAVGAGGLVLSSRDTAAWTHEKSATSKSLYGAAASGGQLIAVGVEGVIIRQQVAPLLDPVEILDFQSAGAMQSFLFGGVLDQEIILESTPGFSLPWQAEERLEISSPSATAELQVPIAPSGAKIYRLRTLSPQGE